MTATVKRPKALFLINDSSFELIYGPDEQRDLAKLVELIAPPQTKETIAADPSVLREAEIILSGWGVPRMDARFLDAAPNLRAVFHGAGSVRPFTTEALWERNILVTSAYAANALPVAEYTLGVMLLSLKHFWSFAAGTRRGEGWSDHTRLVPGGYRTTVAFISCGMIARRIIQLLKPFDLQAQVYCPFLSDAEARSLGVQRCDLDEAFARGDVVSLHTPDLPETRGMITGRHFRSMKKGATFINSARGAVVRQEEMIAALKERPDLTAVLDVVHPEPPPLDDEVAQMPNIVLTPHIAGSMSGECRRLGRYVVNEVERYVAGQPPQWPITREAAEKLA